MNLQYRVTLPPQKQKKPQSNYISTTKYSIITFLPLALIIQFKRYANIYFLVCAILQSIPLISPLSPFSAIAPLIFVLSLSIVRQGFQDYKRYRSDEADNSQQTQRYKQQQFQQTKWKDLLKGDFIKISKDQVIPADALLIICSHPSGIAYVQTSSLDGQKNLKPKFSVAQVQKLYNNVSNINILNKMNGQLKCINPSAQIQKFQGIINFSINNNNNLTEIIKNERINKKNMLLRGCKLKNVDWIIGMVIYIGESTAIMMNGSQPYTKTSNIQRKVNSTILLVMLFEILCSLGSAVYCYYGCVSNYSFQQLLFGINVNCVRTAAISFGSYFILYSTFIPISLIVSLEFVKVFQGYFMSKDRQMYCGINDRALQCHSVSINEQLGQIQYILTDKTGTLTCNKMEFKNIVIGSKLYGQSPHLQQIPIISYQRFSSRYSQFKASSVNQAINSFDSRALLYDLKQQESPKKIKNLQRQRQKQMIQLMFLMIATCHECVPSQKHIYQGPSPDEVALLKAAYQIGFKFLCCQNKIIKVNCRGKMKQFQLLKLIEFDSDRKRMTVVLKSLTQILVFVKGADTSIQKLLIPNQYYLKQVKNKTNQMTKTGLRSLWFGYKVYPIDTNIYNISNQNLQKDLTLIGATGIQDKLQDYVAETIYSLRQGGIKFIMLTGDKLQTAQNIALSCKLIQEGHLISGSQELNAFVKQVINKVNNGETIQKSPVIDGSTLSFYQCSSNLLILVQNVKSVVFCRVTPGQKAEIVKLVKELGKLTLAIGDGANDVNMIMQAHVGVGIFGEEGTRAAQVANYAIGQFCLLWKLLLYYGRLNYMRITQMILYFFYKNMVFTSVQFAYCFYALGSGQSFWLSWSITFYNMIFTFFPVVLRAVFQIDIELEPTKQTFHQLSQGSHDKQILYSYYPKMYQISQKNKLFTNPIFFSWFFLGFFQGIICLLLTIYAMGDQNDSSGTSSYQVGFYLAQISAYTSIIIVVTIKLAVNVKHWTVLLIIGFIIPSIGAYVAFTFIQSIFQQTATYESMINLLSMPVFYVVQLLCVGGMFSLDFFLFSIKATKDNFYNYIKIKTLKNQRLSQSYLKNYILQQQNSSPQKLLTSQ